MPNFKITLTTTVLATGEVHGPDDYELAGAASSAVFPTALQNHCKTHGLNYEQAKFIDGPYKIESTIEEFEPDHTPGE